MHADCKKLFGRSLFFVGAFGANDYLLAMAAAKSLEQVRSFVPGVVRTIVMDVEVTITYKHPHSSSGSSRPATCNARTACSRTST